MADVVGVGVSDDPDNENMGPPTIEPQANTVTAAAMTESGTETAPTSEATPDESTP